MKYSKTLGSVALSGLLLLGVSGCNSSNNPVAEVGETPITPYTRVAVIENKDWSDVNAIAEKIAQYVIYTDESNSTSNGGVLDLPTNWVIAGANGGSDGYSKPFETYQLEDLLPIPVGTNKSRVIEFCNKAYATEAIATGRFHGSALPCEVSVHSENGNVYVDMLDAGAIFNIFFTDTKDDFNQTQIDDFAKMAAAVKDELGMMIEAALKDTADGVTGTAAIPFEPLYDEMGPEFTEDKIENDIAFRSPYIVYKYKRQSGNPFVKGTDDKILAENIIETMNDGSVDLNANGGFLTAEDTAGLEGLSAGSLWRSGRPDPIAIPNVQVVEACSPKYAKKATALGNEYITALPCEFTVYVDETDDTNETIAISFLNPNFMFGTMFEGAVTEAYDNGNGTLTKDQVIEYSILADVVFGDLRMIVDHAVQHSTNLGGLVIIP